MQDWKEYSTNSEKTKTARSCWLPQKAGKPCREALTNQGLGNHQLYEIQQEKVVDSASVRWWENYLLRTSSDTLRRSTQKNLRKKYWFKMVFLLFICEPSYIIWWPYACGYHTSYLWLVFTEKYTNIWKKYYLPTRSGTLRNYLNLSFYGHSII